MSLGQRMLWPQVTWALPASGVVHVMPGSETIWRCVADVLGRRAMGPETRVWGRLTMRGLDWRVCAPAAVLSAMPSGSGATTARSYVVAGLPPDQVAATLMRGAKEARAQVARWFEASGDSALDPEAQWAELGGAARQRVALVLAALRDAPLCVIEPPTDAMSAGWVAAVERAASERLVLCRGGDWAVMERLGGEVVGLGRGGLVRLGNVAQARARWEAWDPEAAPEVEAPRLSPGWLRWTVPQRLGGMPRPGLKAPLDGVVAELVAHGVTHVVTLEEEPGEEAALRAAGIAPWHMPIVDMEAPEADETRAMCARLRAVIEGDRGVVMIHCKEGIGRTGTLLASYLITGGYSYAQALMLLRLVNPHYIQSSAQHAFLRALERTSRVDGDREQA